MTVILCFGDSNTHGTPPMQAQGEYNRFGSDVRWPTRMARALGCELVEEGLPGRTAQWADAVMGPQMNGIDGLKIALQSHGPIDWLKRFQLLLNRKGFPQVLVCDSPCSGGSRYGQTLVCRYSRPLPEAF